MKRPLRFFVVVLLGSNIPHSPLAVAGTDAEFLDVFGIKVFLLAIHAIHSHLNYGFYPLPHLSKSG
jgi:hypothetical protein